MTTVSIDERRKFRGKFLGEVNANNADSFIKKHGIAEGTFDDLYVGDWFISVVKTDRERVVPFRIADFDIYDGTSSTAAKQHHVCIVPDTVMLKGAIYGSKDWEFKNNGYGPSEMNRTIMDKIDKAMESIFGKHLLTYTEMLSYGLDGDVKPSMVKGVLMSEIELKGYQIDTIEEDDVFIDRRLALFTEQSDFINPTDICFWIRGISDDGINWYAFCDTDRDIDAFCANYVFGVRPRFLLG